MKTNNWYIQSYLDWLASQVGYLEKKSNADLDQKLANAGYNNYVCYWNFFDPQLQGQPWCLRFVRSGLWKLGLLNIVPSSDGCTTAMNTAKKEKTWYTVPELGDFIIFGTSPTSATHVGAVVDIDKTYVYTTEGNTSAGTAVVPNGGGVYNKQYLLNNPKILGYIRPKWPIKILEGDVLDMTKDELTKLIDTRIAALAPVKFSTLSKVPSWSQAAVKKAIDNGIVSGTGKKIGTEIELDISMDVLRLLVVLDKSGILEKK